MMRVFVENRQAIRKSLLAHWRVRMLSVGAYWMCQTVDHQRERENKIEKTRGPCP